MMAEECTHDCSSCGSACASRQKPQSLLAPANAGSRVKKVIGVVSGKGGVGKSLVTGLLACETARRGKIAGVLDADITGPSMPRILGIRDKAVGNELGILPQEAENGVKVMSINLLLEHDTDPVIWRGPVGMIVEKAVKMAQMMNIPVLGLVENMAYMTCPDCGKRLYPFGEGRTADVAKQYGLPMLAQLPIQPEIAKKCDEGRLMDIQLPEMGKAVDAVLKCKVRKHE